MGFTHLAQILGKLSNKNVFLGPSIIMAHQWWVIIVWSVHFIIAAAKLILFSAFPFVCSKSQRLKNITEKWQPSHTRTRQVSDWSKSTCGRFSNTAAAFWLVVKTFKQDAAFSLVQKHCCKQTSDWKSEIFLPKTKAATQRSAKIKDSVCTSRWHWKDMEKFWKPNNP